jgi:hypothetical protein
MADLVSGHRHRGPVPERRPGAAPCQGSHRSRLPLVLRHQRVGELRDRGRQRLRGVSASARGCLGHARLPGHGSAGCMGAVPSEPPCLLAIRNSILDEPFLFSCKHLPVLRLPFPHRIGVRGLHRHLLGEPAIARRLAGRDKEARFQPLRGPESGDALVRTAQASLGGVMRDRNRCRSTGVPPKAGDREGCRWEPRPRAIPG